MRWNPSRQRVPTRDIQLPHARRESWLFLLYATFFVAAAFATGLLIRHFPLPLGDSRSFLTDLWYVLLFKLVLLLIVPIALHHSLGHRLKELLFGWRPRPASLLWVLAAALAGASLNLQWLSSIRAAAAKSSPLHVVACVGLGTLVALATAGLPEELFFRGILQTRLECALGRLPAVVLTTVFFTAWHLPTRYLLSNGIEGHAGSWMSVAKGTGIPVAIGSLVFCWAWDRFRNLPALVAAHAAADAVPFVAFLLGVAPR